MLSFLVFILSCYSCAGSRILVVFPMPAPSHYILGNALARGLAEAGHDVTIVSPFEEKNPPKNGKYTNVVLTGMYEAMLESFNNKKVSMFDMEKMSPVMAIPFIDRINHKITEDTLNHPNLQGLIKSNATFDAVIVEQVQNDALKALAHYYNAPLIVFSTVGPNKWVNRLVANPEPSSYIPNVFSSFLPKMNFWERLQNVWTGLLIDFNFHFLIYPAQNRLMKAAFPDFPELDKIVYNVSLVLLNSHESISQAVPHVPNMVAIGGYHVNPPKPLPKELKDFMDSAKEGVVYFSMGSNLQPSTMPEEKRNILLKALGKLKEKVLWKWDGDLPNKPPNVMTSKWFPQQDILAHPNTKLFITHGGLLSTTETVYHGVPVLAFPIFGDQKLNAARAEGNGIGKVLAFSDITEEKLTALLKKLLENPRYRENVKQRSKLMHDRPTKPLDLAVYWTEFVIRHNGAPHLQVEGINLSWYQYMLLDVIGFSVIVIVATFVVLYKLLGKLCFKKNVPKRKIKRN